MNIRAIYSGILIVTSLSMISLLSFLVYNYSKISKTSLYKVLALLTQHFFFIIMGQKLTRMDLIPPRFLEWILEWNAGLFIISNATQFIIYQTSPLYKQNIVNVENHLDPVSRTFIVVWNAWFLAIWIYNSLCFLLLLLIITLLKRWFQNGRQAQLQALSEKVSRFRYHSLNEYDRQQCSICLMSYEEEDQISKTGCGHLFHSACLQKWYDQNITCPLCRQLLI